MKSLIYALRTTMPQYHNVYCVYRTYFYAYLITFIIITQSAS